MQMPSFYLALVQQALTTSSVFQSPLLSFMVVHSLMQ
jgi:hypothetical protein